MNQYFANFLTHQAIFINLLNYNSFVFLCFMSQNVLSTLRIWDCGVFFFIHNSVFLSILLLHRIYLDECRRQSSAWRITFMKINGPSAALCLFRRSYKESWLSKNNKRRRLEASLRPVEWWSRGSLKTSTQSGHTWKNMVTKLHLRQKLQTVSID